MKTKEVEDVDEDEENEEDDENIICLTPSKDKPRVTTQKFRITNKDAAYQVVVWAHEATQKRINEQSSYKWNCLTIQKYKKGSAKSYDCDIPLKLMPKLQSAFDKIFSANKGCF